MKTKARKKDNTVTEGSGNVFADMGEIRFTRRHAGAGHLRVDV